MMKRLCYVLAAIVLAAVLVLPAYGQAGKHDGTREAGGPGTVFQVSTINALLQGLYDGEITCGELKKQGNLGIGTFDGLDGEMVVVDGKILQVEAGGRVIPAPDGEKTPFAAVTFFQADQTCTVQGVADFAQLQRRLDELIQNRNLFYAIRIDGTFAYVKTRSVPRQVKPYPPLAAAVKNQAVFEMQNVRGTVVGFYCPPYVQGLNVPGYHLHFISEDRRQGGHLLECNLLEGTAGLEFIRKFSMLVPGGRDFAQANLTTDRKEELRQVESK